jgi:nucleotide-binding universal stress UspA family protein
MYSRILVPIDGSGASLKGLGEAIKLAKDSGARLKLVHIVDELVIDSGFGPSVYYEPMIVGLREGGKKILADAEATVRAQNVQFESQMIEVIGTRVADQIVQVAKQWGAELIVMGTHGRRGLMRLAMGSDAEMVLRRSPTPVLLVRETPEA